MDKKQRQIELVQKVLAKTQNNNNEHEVQLAICKAQELMVKFGLESTDIDDIEISSNKKEVLKDEVTSDEKVIWWMWDLGTIIANNFRCHCVKGTSKHSGKKVLKFIGLKQDLSIAKETFIFAKDGTDYFSRLYVARLCDTINLTPMYEREPHQRKFFKATDFTNDKNDYIKGFLIGISDKLKEQVEKNNWGLILVKDEAVVEYIKKQKFRHSSSGSDTKGRGNKEHYNAGYEDGYNMEYKKNLLKC